MLERWEESEEEFWNKLCGVGCQMAQNITNITGADFHLMGHFIMFYSRQSYAYVHFCLLDIKY